jgi:hypothetical protein
VHPRPLCFGSGLVSASPRRGPRSGRGPPVQFDDRQLRVVTPDMRSGTRLLARCRAPRRQ